MSDNNTNPEYATDMVESKSVKKYRQSSVRYQRKRKINRIYRQSNLEEEEPLIEHFKEDDPLIEHFTVNIDDLQTLGDKQFIENSKLQQSRQQSIQQSRQQSKSKKKYQPNQDVDINSKDQIKQKSDQTTLQRFFTITSKPNKVQQIISQFTTSVFYDLGQPNTVCIQEWNDKRQRVFQKFILNPMKFQDNKISVSNYLQQHIRRPQKITKKYYELFDSMKVLNGYINLQNIEELRRNYLIKYRQINYDMDSDLEVQDVNAIDLNDEMRSSEQSDSSSDDWLISDDQLNCNLLQKYDMKTNFNQIQLLQMNDGGYKPYQYFSTTNSLEIQDYFHKFKIDNLENLDFPLRLKSKTKTPQKVDVKDLLLFVHGRQQSKRKIADEYQKIQPKFSRNGIIKKINELCRKSHKKQFLIQDQVMDQLGIKDKANQILIGREQNPIGREQNLRSKDNINSIVITMPLRVVNSLDSVCGRGDNLFNSGNDYSVFGQKIINLTKQRTLPNEKIN